MPKEPWVRERVACLLEQASVPLNDALLCALYWRLFEGVPISEEALAKLKAGATSPDSILRRRRELAGWIQSPQASP